MMSRENLFVCSFVCMVFTSTSAQRALSPGYGQFMNVVDNIIQLSGWISELCKIGRNDRR